MGQIRLYRKIYCVELIATSSGTTQTYTLINPYQISASSYVAGTGATESNTLIESNTPISQESTGIYYTDLNPNMYATDMTYDLVWYVQYLADSPLKKLTTRFRLNNQFDFSSDMTFNIENNALIIEII